MTTQSKIKREAEELAERCAIASAMERFPHKNQAAARDLYITETKRIILQEANPESLLMDKACLDWIDSRYLGTEFWLRIAGEHDIRQAILQAIESEGGE